MASTTSSLLKLELQTTGENSSTWGNKLNDTLSQAEIAITGEVTVSMAGSANVTLTDVDFSASQSRYAVLGFTGAITASVKAICPARVKWFYAINTTTQSTTHTYSMSVGTSSGTAVAIPNHGLPVLIYCDGTNCVTPQTALPSCHTATSTDTSLTTSIVVLPIAAADIVSDPYSMISTAANTVIIPAGVELMLVQLNIFSDITDDTTALAAAIFANGHGGTPGSDQLPAYWENSTISARATGNLKTTNVSALIYNPLQIHTLNGSTRGSSISFGALCGTGTATLYGHTIDAVVLR